MSDRFRFGIISTGTIAHAFATGLAASESCELYAVGSRTQESADKFASEFGTTKAYPSYEELVNDPEVEAIYVGTPHPFHHENTMLALQAGKPVICEKPFTLNEKDTRELIDFARKQNLFLMEAMWTRFFPIMEEVRRLVKDGTLGDIKCVEADFGFTSDYDEDSRLYDPELGGGSLLDVGIYPLSFASMILGPPKNIHSFAQMAPTGVDELAAIILGYDDGIMAVCKSSIRVDTPQEATVVGTEGYLRISAPFWQPSEMVFVREGKEEKRFQLPYSGNGYNYEADEVARCVRAGLVESPTMPHEESLQLMNTMDAIREQWGLVYPAERA